jgi:hypothetical protein
VSEAGTRTAAASRPVKEKAHRKIRVFIEISPEVHVAPKTCRSGSVFDRRSAIHGNIHNNSHTKVFEIDPRFFYREGRASSEPHHAFMVGLAPRLDPPDV